MYRRLPQDPFCFKSPLCRSLSYARARHEVVGPRSSGMTGTLPSSIPYMDPVVRPVYFCPEPNAPWTARVELIR